MNSKHTSDVESNPQNKFLEIYNITSTSENGTTFEMSIEKTEILRIISTGAEISIMNSVAYEQLHLFDKIYDSNILVPNASGTNMDAKEKVTNTQV